MNCLNLFYVAILLLCVLDCVKFARSYCWQTSEAANWGIEHFKLREAARPPHSGRGIDKRGNSPFINGDGFRELCRHHCDEINRCRMTPEEVRDGECVFVKSDFYEFFARDVTPRIPGRYIIISHNGDQSAPDGQDDAPRIGMPRFVTTDILEQEYKKGRLIAHHGQNLWWKNSSILKKPRPEFIHCVPIGFENRQYPVGKNVHVYVEALRRNVLNRPNYTIEEEAKRPLILVAFYPKSRIPDRHKVLAVIKKTDPNQPCKKDEVGCTRPGPFFNETDLNHEEWLDAIVHHRFVLAPFGHGLDTHRVSEILLMGGIPVMRKATTSSCFDDTDNHFLGTHRGSLPIVWLDKWEDLTKERLEQEWLRITSYPKGHWDWKRVYFDHWVDRVLAKPQTHENLHPHI